MGEQCPTKNPVQDRSKHCGWGVIRQLLEGRDGWEELGFIERRALQGGEQLKQMLGKKNLHRTVAGTEWVPKTYVLNDEYCLEQGIVCQGIWGAQIVKKV